MADDDVNSETDLYDKYAELEEYEDRLNLRRAEKGAKKPRPISTLAETLDLSEGGATFETTYKPSRHEAGWLLSSLQTFYEQNLITDVLAQVKGGKEASVYRCQAHPATGETFLAAKVYRPQKFRNLRNDKMYREGRPNLTANGTVVKASDQRVLRALTKKSDFGEQVRHTSWLMYEYTTLTQLFADGANVPKPYAAGENAILMTYHGDETTAAPTLSEVTLDPDEAGPLFDVAIRNIELLLEHGLIHGDLSAFNILYWAGTITLIDFPQVASVAENPHARSILDRDIRRICDYFSRQGISCNPAALSDDLWYRHCESRPESF